MCIRDRGDGAATFIAALPAWLCALPLTALALPLNQQVGRPWSEGVFVGLYAKLTPWPDLGFDLLNPVVILTLAASLPALIAAAVTGRQRAGTRVIE